MKSRRPVYFLIIMSLAFLPVRCYADAALALYGTFHSMGVIVTIGASDDPDEDAQAHVEYRRGEELFHSGFPLSRISGVRFAGSLFRLQPGVTYDVRVTISDPDGGPLNGAVREGTLATRPELSVPVPANSHYSSPNGSGSTCSIDTPCSLSQALQLAQAGDEVVLLGGVYSQGEFQLPRSGAEGAPIVIRGYEGQTAVLDGADPAPFTWTAQGGGVYRTTLNVENPHVVMADGQRLFPYASLADLQDLTVGVPGFYTSDTALYVRLGNDENPNAATMSVSRFNHAFYLSGRNHIRISDLTFRHYGQGSYPKAIYIDTSSDVTVEKCLFAYNDIGVGLKRESHRNVIQDNEFKDAIFNWPWNAIKSTGGLEDGGVVFYDPCTGRGNVIRRNVFHDDFDGFGTCPEMEGAEPTNETDVYENVVYNMGDDGVSADGRCSNVRLWDNTFYDVLIGVSMAPVYDGPVYAIRNLIHRTGVGNNDYPGSSFKFNSGYSKSGPMYLFHNTSDAYYLDTSGIQIKSPGIWQKIHARNNIWSGTEYAILNDNMSQPIDLDYDGLYTTAVNELVYWGYGDSRHMRDLDTFRQLTGQESNGLSCEPGFSDPASRDYSLASGSCLIDKGLVIPGINDGFSGTAPDIGAFEHLATPGLEQALLILQVQAGMQPNGVDLINDFDKDGRLGLSDVVYILQKAAGLR